MDQFLSGLPSFNPENFSRFQVDHSQKNCTSKRPPIYVSEREHPNPQIITTEKSNILLRYLDKEWADKRALLSGKRDSRFAKLDPIGEDGQLKKVPKYEDSSRTFV